MQWLVHPYKGSCHCGAIQFSFEVELFTHGVRCNCSFCSKRGAMLHPVPCVKTLAILSLSFALAACGGGGDGGGAAPPAHFAYVANSDSGNVSQYSIELDGSLTPMATPAVDAGTHPQLIVVDPSGKQLMRRTMAITFRNTA